MSTPCTGPNVLPVAASRLCVRHPSCSCTVMPSARRTVRIASALRGVAISCSLRLPRSCGSVLILPEACRRRALVKRRGGPRSGPVGRSRYAGLTDARSGLTWALSRFSAAVLHVDEREDQSGERDEGCERWQRTLVGLQALDASLMIVALGDELLDQSEPLFVVGVYGVLRRLGLAQIVHLGFEPRHHDTRSITLGPSPMLLPPGDGLVGS